MACMTRKGAACYASSGGHHLPHDRRAQRHFSDSLLHCLMVSGNCCWDCARHVSKPMSDPAPSPFPPLLPCPFCGEPPRLEGKNRCGSLSPIRVYCSPCEAEPY